MNFDDYHRLYKADKIDRVQYMYFIHYGCPEEEKEWVQRELNLLDEIVMREGDED